MRSKASKVKAQNGPAPASARAEGDADEDEKDEPGLPPQTLRRRLRATAAVLMAQEAAAQLRNDVTALLREHHDNRARLPGKIALKALFKNTPSALAMGRAKQAQYAIVDAAAMFASYRSNFFDWALDHSSRPGKPKPPRFYCRGQRARVRLDYQDFSVEGDHLRLPDSFGLDPLPLVDRAGKPLLKAGDRLVEVRLEPCRSRLYVDVNLVIRRAPPIPSTQKPEGSLLIDLGVARLVTCLDDKNVQAFFVDGGVAKAILQRGAKWHARLRSEAKLGVRHGKRRARQLAARSARQMEDLMKKVARLVVTYAEAHHLATVAVGRNVNWKQGVDLGTKQNQLFAFIPHAKLIDAIRTKCARAGIQFIETEESYTSKTDHLAQEEMGPKPEGYRWLGSRCQRGSFRSSVGLNLQADVNGCIGIGRKVGGEEWLAGFRQKLGTAPGTRLVPRKVHVNGAGPGQAPGPGSRPIRLLSPRAWITTEVALVKARLWPDLQRVAVSGSVSATHIPQILPKAA